MQESNHLNVRLAGSIVRRLLAELRVDDLASGVDEALVALLNSLLLRLPLCDVCLFDLIKLDVIELLVVAQVLVWTSTFFLSYSQKGRGPSHSSAIDYYLFK